MNRVIIIAEAGVNHNGDLDLAFKLVDVAKEAGADIVKFQTSIPELSVSKFAVKANYQKKSTRKDESQLDMIKSISLPFDDIIKLKKYAEDKGISFLCTPFDLISMERLNGLELPISKIPSGEITNLLYLRKVAGYGKPIILSTGMATLGEIEAALNVLENYGTHRDIITVLHCNTEYPTPLIDVNLNAMLTIKNAFGVEVGYSDHTLGIEVPIAAVALGATIIEKHFTLDRTYSGPDHKASLEPHELKSMVDAVRNIEVAMGDGIKKTSASEQKNKPIARKSIVASSNIKMGDIFSESNLAVKRPGNGISPMRWDELIGLKSPLDFSEDEMIVL
ncbi:N-acetylneuraminate synthase [Oceanospirillaceae bacterium]|nr:N-acetylneuraminate synthase [bacterium]MDB4214356.1 N-acetylneuraminate synthase [Oceanospirillaceae bacterium]